MREDPFAKIEVDVDPSRHRETGVPLEETPFRVLLIGDFAGRERSGNTAGGPLDARRTVRVDRDNIDEVLSRFAPIVSIPLDTGPLEIRFAEVDDFHPDHLVQNVPSLAALVETRRQLADPRTFARAAADLRAQTKAPERKPVADRPAPAGLLDDVLRETAPQISDIASGDDLAEFIRRSMAPHLVPNADPAQHEMVAGVDAAITRVLRALMHHPAFQSVEALWREVFFLVRRVDTSAMLQLHLLDMTRAELSGDLATMHASGLPRLAARLAALSPSEPWSLVVVEGAFGDQPTDLARLARLAASGRALGAPCLVEASPRLAAADDDATFEGAWDALRRSVDAPYLGLALPRFLLRLPYGANEDPIDTVPFEEMESANSHASYLWGNPAGACAMLLATSFADQGWSMSPSAHLDIDGLPLHLTREDGEIVAKPCAEVVMGEREAFALLDRGLVPLIAYQASDRVRVARIQSVAEPGRPLAGRWAR
jgi:type VI secretion system protein ImpC